MKKILLGFLLLTLLSCQPSKTYYEKVDALSGYKELTLDAPYEVLKKKVDMRLTQYDQCKATKKYEIKSDKYLLIGAVRFDKVELEFVRDSLYRTTLYTKDTYETAAQLHAMYRKEFGEPHEVKDVGYKSTEWNGKNHTIHFVDRVQSSDFEVEYASNKGLRRSIDEERACNERKAKKSRSEL
ncbi:hypothetical protein GO755_34665 [Spirosoma sp. HMF4905]|uniref:Lipoprotein n=1 Tax=Spirosoma arboris TaxID=2682092 RepID=A0A7K1SN41_9BACT|nr:hypothetical protein [Spirosoma arboris]MVM35218.1 hypothetical protein [Spirosoma arboris]